MTYTQAEREKIHRNIDAIKAYIEEYIQLNISDRIEVDFGQTKSYMDGTREKEFHLYVSPTSISCRQGGLGFDFEKKSTRSSTLTTVYTNLEYAIALLKNWHSIKATLNTAIAHEKATREMINNFEV